MDTFFRKFKKEKELSNKEKSQVYYRDAKLMMEQELYDKAIERLREAIDLDRNNADAHDFLGRCYIEKGRDDEATAELRKALQLDADRWETHYHLGMIHGRAKNYEEAIREYELELSLNPRYGAAHNNLAVAYYVTRNYPLALQHHDKAKSMGCYINPEFQEAIEKIRKNMA